MSEFETLQPSESKIFTILPFREFEELIIALVSSKKLGEVAVYTCPDLRFPPRSIFSPLKVENHSTELHNILIRMKNVEVEIYSFSKR